MLLHLHHSLPTAVRPSPNVLRIAAMFGLGLDDQPHLQLIPPITLNLTPKQLIFITGPSGSGKSTILRLITNALTSPSHAHPRESDHETDHTRIRLIRFDDLPPLPDAPLVDCFNLPLEDTLSLLARAGLADAFVMLRRPAELSDGQRYRLRLAQTMAIAHQHPEADLIVILADEFGAVLDRITASVIARNVRRWTTQMPNLCFIAATTHDDLLEPLDPDVLIEKQPGSEVAVVEKEVQNAKGSERRVQD